MLKRPKALLKALRACDGPESAAGPKIGRNPLIGTLQHSMSHGVGHAAKLNSPSISAITSPSPIVSALTWTLVFAFGLSICACPEGQRLNPRFWRSAPRSRCQNGSGGRVLRHFPDFWPCCVESFLHFDFQYGRFYVPKLRINSWISFGSSGARPLLAKSSTKPCVPITSTTCPGSQWRGGLATPTPPSTH